MEPKKESPEASKPTTKDQLKSSLTKKQMVDAALKGLARHQLMKAAKEVEKLSNNMDNMIAFIV